MATNQKEEALRVVRLAKESMDLGAPSFPASTPRTLVYRGPSRGQGIGVTMHGVAAALELGRRHDRMVCVSWRDFEHAFAVSQRGRVCPDKSEYFVPSSSDSTMVLNAAAQFELWSFGGGGHDDSAAEALLGSDRRVVLMSGDGGRVALNSSLEFPFVLRDDLLALLPTVPHRIVAHLRLGDEHEGGRRGLFRGRTIAEATDALRAALPRDTYVLSDSQAVYDALCGTLACPAWRSVPHSAERSLRNAADGRGLHTLRTWADWWAIKSASEHVLATPSAFASSAHLFSRAAHCSLTDFAALARCAGNASLPHEEHDRIKAEAARRTEADARVWVDSRHERMMRALHEKAERARSAAPIQLNDEL